MARTLALIGWLVVSGCSFAGQPYAVHPDTIVALRAHTGRTVQLAAFTSDKPGKSEIMCRLVGMIQTPNGEPFEEYVYNAFRSEMLIAGLAAATAPVTLGGHLRRMHFTTGSEAVWELELTLASSNGRRLTMAEVYEFNWHLIGDHACREVTTAMPLAVQSLIRKTVQHPDFPALLTPGVGPSGGPTSSTSVEKPLLGRRTMPAATAPAAPAPMPTVPDLRTWVPGTWRSLGRSNELEITPSLRWQWASAAGGHWTGRGDGEVQDQVLILRGWHSTSIPMMLRLTREGERLVGELQTSRTYRIIFEREPPQ